MNRLTLEQRLQITERTIRETINKLRSSFILLDFHLPTRVRRSRSNVNIAAVAESVREDRNQLIRRRFQVLGLSYGTLWRIGTAPN